MIKRAIAGFIIGILVTFVIFNTEINGEKTEKLIAREGKVFITKFKALFNQGNGVAVPRVSATPTPTPVSPSLAKEHSELLYEMMVVIYDSKEIQSKSDFGELAHTLNEGASLEGIYRGIIMGPRYQGMESQSQGASPAVLKAFALELAEIQSDMLSPTVYHEGESKRAPSIDYPDGTVSAEAPTIVENDEDGNGSESPVRQKKKLQDVALEHLKMFVGASVFTLKRVLCEEALRKMDEFQTPDGRMNTTDLAQWYAKLAVRLSEKNIDFGLPERNKGNFDFHFKWAQHMAADRVKWEVLNRYHRMLNATAKLR